MDGYGTVLGYFNKFKALGIADHPAAILTSCIPHFVMIENDNRRTEALVTTADPTRLALEVLREARKDPELSALIESLQLLTKDVS